MSNIELRNWQIEATKQCIDWLTKVKASKHFIINAAPGAGKTICASVIAAQLIDQDEIDRVIIIAPRAEVVKQWAEEFYFVTKRHMSRITGSDGEIENFGVDLCATWSAISNLQDGFQRVCNSSKTLVICDEHHHAAVAAAWGDGADSAFKNAKYTLILTGTPMRSDGSETVWVAFDDKGQINQPAEGMYTLSYGKAVDLGYCRPVTFHRHEGMFTVAFEGGPGIKVSGNKAPDIPENLKDIRGLKNAVDFYRLACTRRYLSDGVTPDLNSYQATMLKYGIEKLNEQRLTIPKAGGLVIAPNIAMAEYMAEILEMLEGEKPTIVHSNNRNADQRIAAFRNTSQKWIVSVAMISEGVDIKRLRVMVYLPNARTELAFRQAVGRVVRSLGKKDMSSAYVIMPILKTLEKYAQRIENEMSPIARKAPQKPTKKICPSCEHECELNDKECSECGHEFPEPKKQFKKCENCGQLNPVSADECSSCGESFKSNFTIELSDAFRDGGYTMNVHLTEEEMLEGESLDPSLEKDILSSGQETLIALWSRIPPAARAKFINIVNQPRD